MSELLTKEQLEELRKPFPAGAISFKCQTKPNDKGNCLVVAYIDARDVMDRLDNVIGPDWGDRYEKAGTPRGLVCYLTVAGVTRADVGDDDSDNEATKSAYSDAFKRAAVKFGIGRFLYDLPKMYAKAKPMGKSFVLEDGEADRLRRIVDAALNGKQPPAAKPSATGPERAKAPETTKSSAAATIAEAADLRREHGSLWLRLSKAGLVNTQAAVQAWSITATTPDEEVRTRIDSMQDALRQVPAAKSARQAAAMPPAHRAG